MSRHRFGKARVPGCTCETNFTCGACLAAAKPYTFTPGASMLRHSQSILLPDGRTLYLQQLAEGESKDEFEGRALCEVERVVGRVRGTRWVRWDHYGHPLGAFNTDGFGVLIEHTGEPYTNRTQRIPGLFNEAEARRALGIGG